MSAAYRTPDVWATDVDPAYEALGQALVAASPVPLAGRLVVDLGAGTGATSRAISAAGGWPLAIDLSHPMLAYRRTERPPGALADMTALPLAPNSVGGALAAFSLSHVDHPAAALSEAARVTEGGGPVLAGVFAASGVRHPASAIVDRLASGRGWVPPPWYVHLKQDLEPRIARPEELARLAVGAGLTDVTVLDREIDAGLNAPEALVGWRLGHPAVAPFVGLLPPAQRHALKDEAIVEVGTDLQPLRLTVRMLSSIVAATR